MNSNRGQPPTEALPMPSWRAALLLMAWCAPLALAGCIPPPDLPDIGPLDAACVPGVERCNGVDDDCDGETDEEMIRACYAGPEATEGVGPCRAGIEVCDAGQWSGCAESVLPAGERCNGLDDDCNGAVDDVPGAVCACTIGEEEACYTGPPGTVDVGSCQRGRWRCGEREDGGAAFGPCTGDIGPVAELCNEIDDDCDGAIDEAFPALGTTCGAGQGACAVDGRWVCDGSGAAICDAIPGEPSAEACTGVDDDCDGETDEGFGLGGACSVGRGACTVDGTLVCDGAGQRTCSAQAGPSIDEQCNGLDDDCDGVIDEGVPGCGVVCGPADERPSTPPCNGAEGGTEVPAGWVVLPPGDFMVGDADCNAAAPGPHIAEGQYAVRIERRVFMQATEVTRGAWRQMVDAENEQPDPGFVVEVPPAPPGCGNACDDLPIDLVSRLDALWYANALSRSQMRQPRYDPRALALCSGHVGGGCDAGERCGCAPGDVTCGRPAPDSIFQCPPEALARLANPLPGRDGFRLPTAAEWARGARAGTSPVPTRLDGGGLDGPCVCGAPDFACPQVWWGVAGDDVPPDPEACGEGSVVRSVSAGAANPFGLYEMVGNVSEHVDTIGAKAAEPDDPLTPLVDPLGPVGIDAESSLGSQAGAICLTSRASRAPARFRARGVGFRLVDDRDPGPRFDLAEIRPPAVEAGQWRLDLQVENPANLRLTATAWLWRRQRSLELATIDAVGARAELLITFDRLAQVLAEANAAPGPEGSGPHMIIVALTDGAGRRVSRGLRLRAGCDGSDDDGDGRADHPDCADVLCEGDPDGPPPCNAAPAGTVVPHGWVYIAPGPVTIGSADDPGTHNFPPAAAQVSRGFLMMDAEVSRTRWKAAVEMRRLAAPGANPTPSDLAEEPNAPICRDRDTDGDCPVQNINWWEALWLANVLSEEEGLTPCYPTDLLAECTGLPGAGAMVGEGLICDGQIEGGRAHSTLLWPDRLLDGEPAPWPGHPAVCDGYRLPSEAEWLRAVADEAVPAWGVSSRPVRDGAPSAWGLHGMGDNVDEWLADSAGHFVALDRATRDPWGPVGVGDRVARGGDRGGPGRPLCRSVRTPGSERSTIGVRFVRTARPLEAPPARPMLRLVGGRPTVTPGLPGAVEVQVDTTDGGPAEVALIVYQPNASAPSCPLPFEPVDGVAGRSRALLPWAHAVHDLDPETLCGDVYLDGRLIVRAVDQTGATTATQLYFTLDGTGEGGCDPPPAPVCP